MSEKKAGLNHGIPSCKICERNIDIAYIRSRSARNILKQEIKRPFCGFCVPVHIGNVRKISTKGKL